MSTLQESVDARRVAKPTEFACVEVTSQVPSVVIYMSQRKSWVLPWSYLTTAEWEEYDAGDELILTFNTHAVTLTGRNLRQVMNDIAGFRIACLRELPAEYRSRLSAYAPVIDCIKVVATQRTAPHSNQSASNSENPAPNSNT